MRVIFKTKMFIYPSNSSLDENILFGKITHHLGTEIRKLVERGMFGHENPNFHSGP